MLTAAMSASTSLCAQSSHLHSVGDVFPSTNFGLHEIPCIGKSSSVDVGTYVDDVIAKIEDNSGSPIPLYCHSDRQFNVRGLTDSTGAIKELYAYSVYGKQTVLNAVGTVLAGSSYDNNYGFTGRYLDDETDLWYFRARYFSDELGRFISRDPLGYVDGMSLYQGYFASGFGLDPYGKALFKSLLTRIRG